MTQQNNNLGDIVNYEISREREITDSYTVGYFQGLMERPNNRAVFATGAFFGALAAGLVALVVFLL